MTLLGEVLCPKTSVFIGKFWVFFVRWKEPYDVKAGIPKNATVTTTAAARM